MASRSFGYVARMRTSRTTRPVAVVAASVALLIVAAVLGGRPAPASAQSGPVLEFTYSVETRGAVAGDPAHLRRVADDALNDPRGWSLGGSIGFRAVPSGGEMRLILASPAEVDAAAPGCSAEWSCRVGDLVFINDDRFTGGAPGYPLPLADYQSYVVNHEVGHWLGLGHFGCTGPGQPAPVMMQQSISLERCEATVWPTAGEQQRVAGNYAVELRRSEVLARGTVGAGVATWQQQLNEMTGSSLVVDGVYGPDTESATRNFQAFFGLPADGVADPETRGLMRYLMVLEPRELGLWSRGEDVAAWQRDMNQLTGAGLVVDGVYGPRTRGETVNFQRFFELVPHGDVRSQEREVMSYLLAVTGQAE
jgi:hypothetical protein